MNHALAGHSSQRPREHRDIKTVARETRTFSSSPAVFDFLPKPPGGQLSGTVEDRSIRVDADNETRHARDAARQPSLAAPNIKHSRVYELHAALQSTDFGSLGILPIALHPFALYV
jgi:hypothetical protein